MIPITKNETQNEKTINSIINDTEIKSCEIECENTGKKWIRKCPKCDKDIIVSSKKYYEKSLKENRICLSCASKIFHEKQGHISKEDKRKIGIKCPQCGKSRPYYRTILNNRLCKSCVAKNNYPNQKSKLIYGISNNRQHGKTINPKIVERNCPKCDRIIKHTSLHYANKNNHRWCKSCACKENIKKNNINFPFIPSFNPLSCNIIEEYGKKNGYNFQHGLNGGEFYIKELGYWLDGYDKEKNIVIECNEPFHYYSNGNMKSKDEKRQNDIINFLKCSFIRIKYNGKNNTIQKVDILK